MCASPRLFSIFGVRKMSGRMPRWLEVESNVLERSQKTNLNVASHDFSQTITCSVATTQTSYPPSSPSYLISKQHNGSWRNLQSHYQRHRQHTNDETHRASNNPPSKPRPTNPHPPHNPSNKPPPLPDQLRHWIRKPQWRCNGQSRLRNARRNKPLQHQIPCWKTCTNNFFSLSLKRYNPTQPLSTSLYNLPASLDFTTRMAKVLVRRTQKLCYVGGSVNLSNSAGGGSVEEEMEAFRAVVDVVVAEVGRVESGSVV